MSTDSQLTLAERLTVARERRGWTVRDLAGHLDMKSHSQIGAWENGQDPSSDNLARVCRALGVSGHWLLTGRQR